MWSLCALWRGPQSKSRTVGSTIRSNSTTQMPLPPDAKKGGASFAPTDLPTIKKASGVAYDLGWFDQSSFSCADSIFGSALASPLPVEPSAS